MVHWLSKHSKLVGVVWTYSAYWAKTLSGRIQFAKKRLHRFGLMKTVDEALYYALSKSILNEAGEPFQTRLYDAYVREYGYSEWKGESIETHDINSGGVLTFVRERSPDLIMSMCINEFFRREIREIPRLGAFLWHEGLVPEYKGLYSPFWAIHNGEPNMLGYTVLRMNDHYDAGEVFLQGRVSEVNPQTDSPVYIGHKAILDSLAPLRRLFGDLESDTARPILMEGRRQGTYTYPGLTDWIRYRRKIRSLGTEVLSDSNVNSLPAKTLEDRS